MPSLSLPPGGDVPEHVREPVSSGLASLVPDLLPERHPEVPADIALVAPDSLEGLRHAPGRAQGHPVFPASPPP